MLTVVMLSDFPDDPQKIAGGIEGVAWNLAKGLQDNEGTAIHVIKMVSSKSHEHTSTLETITVHRLFAADPIICRRPRVTFGDMTGYWLCRRRIHKLLTRINPDIVHIHGYGLMALAALESEYPVVITIHGLIHKEKELFISERRFPRLNRVLSRYLGHNSLAKAEFVLRRGKHFIIISPYVERELNFNNDKVLHHIFNPINDKWFSLIDREVPNRLLFAGKIIKRKGLDLLISALEKVKNNIQNIEVHIVGPIADHRLYDKLVERIDKAGLQQNITFLGHVGESELHNEYAECAVFVLPSLEETAPLVIAQAMASGKAVIGTHSGGIPDIIEQGKSGFVVDYGDVGGLAQKIEQVLCSKQLRMALGQRGKELATRWFNRRAVANDTLNVYSDIIADYHRGKL